jgi:cytochrome c-type biogenesis protein CcmE
MTRKQRRLTVIGGSLFVLAVAAALVLNAMRDSIVFFSTPKMVAEKHIQPGKRFRLGGLVQPGSLVRGDNLMVRFEVGDGSAALPVSYQGILPDLFREGQGIVAEGALDGGCAACIRGGFVCGPGHASRFLRFFRHQRVREFALDEAVDLQDHRRVG